jgi:hypothetical protein
MLSPLSVCVPLWVVKTFPSEPWFLGLVYSVHGIADLIGAMFVRFVAGSRRPDLMVTAGWALLGFLLALAFCLNNMPLILSLYFLAILCNTACFVHMRAQMTLGVPGGLLGRVVMSRCSKTHQISRN